MKKILLTLGLMLAFTTPSFATEISNYLENKILDHTLGKTSYTMPTNVYLALYTTCPTDSTAGTEVSGGGYSRQVLAWNAAASGVSTNSSPVAFTASGADFGTIVCSGIMDASTSGNLLYFTPMTVNRTVLNGDTITFAVTSGVTVTLD